MTHRNSKNRSSEKADSWIEEGGRQVLELLRLNGELTPSQLAKHLGVREVVLDVFLHSVRAKTYTIMANKKKWYALR